MSAYIASLDVGTTTIRCQIVNKAMEVAGNCSATVPLIYSKSCFVEINPHELWTQVVYVIKSAISSAGIEAADIKSLGISTQRGTFTTWKKDTGEELHNFITWKDMRAKELCDKLNKSLTLQSIRFAAYAAYLITFNPRFLAGSNLHISPNHVTGRLLWVLSNIKNVRDNLDNVRFGTLDTWLISKLTKNAEIHITDISNASATGFFDPFVVAWGNWAKIFLSIPFHILPEIVSNDYQFGDVHSDVFGASIPIKCIMADQSSSMYASGAFKVDDLKLTLGTGAFLDINTGGNIHPSASGIYPVIGWKLRNRLVCMAEVPCNDCGSLIEWLKNAELLEEAKDSAKMVEDAGDNDGVYFIPAFSGLGPPINNDVAASGFIGIKPTTTKKQLIRAVLEAIAFRVALAYQQLHKEITRKYEKITVDGGVGNNDFICQMIANLTELKLERLHTTEMSVWGVALVAAQYSGVWSKLDLEQFRKVEKVFLPDYRKRDDNLADLKQWMLAVNRFTFWYSDD